MKTIEIIESVRVYCARPAHDLLDNGAILTVLQGRIDYYRGRMGATNQDWTVLDCFLNVNANVIEYVIPVGDLSRPIKVEYYDPSSPATPGPEIPIVRLQDSDLVGTNDNFIYGTSNSTATNEGSYLASAIAFYNMNQQIRIIPRPYQNVTYRIFYEPTRLDAPGLLTEPALPAQFHDMLALATAKLCIGMAKLEPDQEQTMLGNIIAGLSQHEQAFDDFRRLSKHSDTRRRRPFRPSYKGGYK